MYCEPESIAPDMKSSLYLLIPLCMCWCWMGCETPSVEPPVLPTVYVYQPQIFATRGDQSVELSWGWYTWGENSPERIDPEFFRLLLSENGGQDWTEVEKIDGSLNQYQLENLENGQSYLVQIEAVADGAIPGLSNKLQFIPGEDANPKDLFLGLDGSRIGASYGLEGNYISYSRVVENKSFVYRYSINAREEFQIAFGFDADWGPVGDQIAFTVPSERTEQDVLETNSILLHSENGPRVLFEGQSHQREMNWSMDGKSLVMLSDLEPDDLGGYGIWTLSLQEGSLPRMIMPAPDLPSHLIDPLDRSPRRPIWGKESQDIIFSRLVQRDSILVQDILSISVNGGEEKIVISSQWNDFAPALSPDGNRLAFISDRSGVDAIWMWNFETNRMRQLTGSSSIELAKEGQKLDWHPRGTTLLFTGRRETEEQTIMSIEVPE